MKNDNYTITSGHLEVGNGHKIYYQQWGNENAKPIFYLHGGPGGGCNDSNKKFFDPTKHHVIFHDQRGCGLSTPNASIESNTTQKLIEDIESLRQILDFKKIQIIGGSWGSALAFAYSIAYPENVTRMLLWGIFAGTKSEVDYIQQGGLRTHFPEAWEQYIDAVPKNMQQDTVSFYYDKFVNGSDAEKTQYTKRWVCLESSALSIDADFKETLYSVDGSNEIIRAIALLEAHYFINNCFMPENHIFNNLSDIAHIPTTLVQGRFDHITPPETAYKIAKQLGKNCHLHIVPGSHSREGAMRETIKAYVWSTLG
ncbi:MAG: prolyl aminopeptidase [Candidatus Saccharibacteria bacterium]|nr:prolyl aminopeptidase [Candidatus Saccharibacteria bacterium]